MPGYEQPFLREGALSQPAERVDSRAVFGQVMGLVAVTVGFFALGAYIGRDLSNGTGLLLFLGSIGCIIGLNVAARRSERLAIVFLFGLGLFFGLALGPVLAYYASSDPAILWQSGGATALSVAALGSYGYATSRNLASWGRALFWALLALIVLGIVLIFVSIPGGHIIYAVAGLVVFGLLTVFDFNRLRRANMDQSVPIAASIFLDVVNIFLFFITLFGGGDRR
jgi:FtsH-binding integral membrane protein